MSHERADSPDGLNPGVLQIGPKFISDFKIWVAERFMGTMDNDEQ